MSGAWEEIHFRAAGLLGQALVEGLFSTIRIRFENEEAYRRIHARGERVIYVFWHEHLLPLVHVHRNQGIAVLVSEHGDGEYIARVLERQGFTTARGSSTRGGVQGVRQLVRAARRGRDLGITPDGPRGPRRRVKPGALQVARLTGLPLVPISVQTDRCWRLGSWDHFLVPKPFTTLRVRYGAPYTLGEDGSSAEEGGRWAKALEATLDRLDSRPDRGSVARAPHA